MSITPEIDLETYDTPHCPECGQDIDTWAVEKQAIEQEQQRIISLLEREPSLNGFAFRDSGTALSAHLVALIKGENK